MSADRPDVGHPRVHLHTFGCKANQYDTERMRQALESHGARTVAAPGDADVVVLNTCTVTSRADAAGRAMVRRVARDRPAARIVVAGCSAALGADTYRAMPEVDAVVPGHDPAAVRAAVFAAPGGGGAAREPRPHRPLVTLEDRRRLDALDVEPVGADLLRRRAAGTRGWLKIQDGCDRRCAFCATRLARGASRSRPAREVTAEARLLARVHPEIVLTGIHIGHWGRDLSAHGGKAQTLAGLVALLIETVPDVRFRLGSVEATEVDDALLALLARHARPGGRLAPHLHMPLQSGADPVLRRMRRWHTREAYRRRALEIAGRVPGLGLGADVIAGFPGETDADHARTRTLVEELPFTYLHVFPFSAREGTPAAALAASSPVPERVAGERAAELRALADAKGADHVARRVGALADVVVERGGGSGLSGDYLRVEVRPSPSGREGRRVLARLQADGSRPYIDLSRSFA